MIEITTDLGDRIIKIKEDWADKNTAAKINGVIKHLYLSERDLVDWEIRVGDEIYPTEEDKKIANEFGDKYSERDRHITTTVTEEDGSESIMTWEETLDLELREGGIYVELDMLFIRR
jgi:hypothetical protein